MLTASPPFRAASSRLRLPPPLLPPPELRDPPLFPLVNSPSLLRFLLPPPRFPLGITNSKTSLNFWPVGHVNSCNERASKFIFVACQTCQFFDFLRCFFSSRTQNHTVNDVNQRGSKNRNFYNWNGVEKLARETRDLWDDFKTDFPRHCGHYESYSFNQPHNTDPPLIYNISPVI